MRTIPGIKNSQQLKTENLWWQKMMLEASLISARMGMVEDAIKLKEQADFWGTASCRVPYYEYNETPKTEEPVDKDFQDFIEQAQKVF